MRGTIPDLTIFSYPNQQTREDCKKFHLEENHHMDLQDHLLHEYPPLLQLHPAIHQEPTKSLSHQKSNHIWKQTKSVISSKFPKQ